MSLVVVFEHVFGLSFNLPNKLLSTDWGSLLRKRDLTKKACHGGAITQMLHAMRRVSQVPTCGVLDPKPVNQSVYRSPGALIILVPATPVIPTPETPSSGLQVK